MKNRRKIENSYRNTGIFRLKQKPEIPSRKKFSTCSWSVAALKSICREKIEAKRLETWWLPQKLQPKNGEFARKVMI